MGPNENCRRNNTLQFPAVYDPVLRKISKSHNFPYALRSIIRFALQSAIFKIFHILGFPIDSHVKISKCHKIFKTCPIAKKSNSLQLYSAMVANVLIKFGWLRMKTVGGVAFWNFQPHMALCWQKFQSAVFFYFWQITKKSNSLY